MAEGMVTDLLRPATEEIGKNIVTLMKRQFNYICCFKRNVQDLREELKNLEDARVGLEKQTDDEKNNAREILPTVDTWLDNAREIENNAKRIQSESSNIQKGCCSMKSRFLWSREAKKATVAIKGLLERGKFDELSVPAPPAAMASIPLEQTSRFPSRNQIEEDVMRALMDEKIKLIGICGMGGVGKTTLASTLRYMAKERGLFDETVMVQISQQVDMMKIQLEIAEYLGFKNIKEVDSLQARAYELHVRLRGTRRTLIILDDIWEEISLVELGIPCENDYSGCKVVLTSRNNEVLNLMDAEIFKMNVLHPEEAWSLFREKVGTCADDPDFRCIAEDVVNECEGLPLAISNVGRALKDKEKHIWEDALHRLRSSNPRNMPQVLEKVYKPIRLSYDFLKDEDAKLLLLLCCQFPEDSNISLEDLTLYTFGLEVLEGVDNLRQARNGVITAIDKLKNSFLLLDGDGEDKVKMHDVIRDVARFIALEEGLVDARVGSRGQIDSSCKWILAFPDGSSKFLEHLKGYKFPSLCLFVIWMQVRSWGILHIEDFTFLEGMQGLNVLSFGSVSFNSLPQTINLLKNLRTLQLIYCDFTNLSVVGELLSLEILSCNNCVEIEGLPIEIGRLKRLKLLDLSNCKRLQRIPPGILTNFVELEELKMLGSFKEWESTNVNEEKKKNASLKELELLHRLTCLEIEIEDKNLVEEEIHLPPRIDKYKILVGMQASDRYENEKVMILRGFSRETNFGCWIQKLASTAQELYLDGDGARDLNLWQVHKTIKALDVRFCNEMKKLVITPTMSSDQRILDGFPHLETLRIDRCRMMEQVFSDENDEDNEMTSHATFPKLKILELKHLPSLKILGKRIESIEFPVLQHLTIINCPKLKTFVSPMEREHSHANECSDGDKFLHLFCNKKVKFGGLTMLEVEGYDNVSYMWCQQIHINFFRQLKIVGIYYCHNLKSLFSSSLVEKFASLQSLGIGWCKNMEQVITTDEISIEKCDETKEEDNGKIISHVIFPKLKKLDLHGLCSLTTFSKGIRSIEFPMLEKLDIWLCPKFVSIVSPMKSCGKWEDECNHEDGSLHLFCSKKVNISGLKDVQIKREDIRSTLWCQQIPTCFFRSLERLEIFECLNLKSLFSSSIVENLVHIKYLRITDCKHIEVAIALDSEMHENHVLFPCLVDLCLQGLPLLRIFSEWKCALEFPTLENLYIVECPWLEFLTNGTISVPKVNYVLVAGKTYVGSELYEIEDLNGFIHQKIMLTREQ